MTEAEDALAEALAGATRYILRKFGIRELDHCKRDVEDIRNWSIKPPLRKSYVRAAMISRPTWKKRMRRGQEFNQDGIVRLEAGPANWRMPPTHLADDSRAASLLLSSLETDCNLETD